MNSDLPKVTGINVINVPMDQTPDEIKKFMDEWIKTNQEITSDPGQVVIFSPYDMRYKFENVEGIDHLSLTGYMDRTKWATLSDADDLRSFAFQLQKNHSNLKVSITLALSIKEFEETNEDYNFVEAYFENNVEVTEMIAKMKMEEKEMNEARESLNEDLDAELFGEK